MRKEAKDLLAALRESSPEASLAHAQQALAQQYGMHDWGELKTEAQRRAAEAPVAPAGLAQELAAAFGLGEVSGPASPVAFTMMGRCWSLSTDRGRWLAVTVYPWITEAQARQGARLRDAAVAAGVVAPVPVCSPQGRLIEAVQEQQWRVHEWIEVGPAPVTPTPAAAAGRVGAIFGRLHRLAIPSQAPINPYLTAVRPAEEWEQLLSRAQSRGKPWAGQLGAAVPGLLELSATAAGGVGEGALILCNCNLIPENVRVGHGDELVVTEWDFAGSLTAEMEIGYALTHWVLRPSLNHRALAAFREGYARAAGSWPRLEPASFAVAVTGWLNWTYSTICEAIDPADADRAAFAERETRDLLHQPMTSLALRQLLDAAGR